MNLRDRPAFYWAALAMLLFLGALLVPTEWTKAVGSLLDPTANPETTAFSPTVAEADRGLRDDRDVEISSERLFELKPYLQARRTSRLGPMTEADVQRLVGIFKELDRQTSPKMAPESRRALRDHFVDEILTRFPRLEDTTDAAEIHETLEQLDDQLKQRRQ